MKRFFTGGSKKWEQKKKPEAEADDAREKDGDFLWPDGHLMIFGGPEAYGSKHDRSLRVEKSTKLSPPRQLSSNG